MRVPSAFLIATLMSGPCDAGAFEPLFGQWECQGGVNGRESQIAMVWEPVLEQRFVRLMWRNDMRTDDGSQTFEGHAYYVDVDGKLSGTWFDSQGSQHQIEASMTEQTLTALWSNEKMSGRTRYTLTETGMDIEDAIAAGEDWRVFGRVSCQRI